MNSRFLNRLCFSAATMLLLGCGAKTVSVDMGDVDDYRAFLDARESAEAPEPFKAEPLHVEAKGKVRAAPDIAVITATITSDHKNESAAFNGMSEKVNSVQSALAGRNIDTGFTSVRSSREFDEKCRNINRASLMRYNQIQSDFYFNRNLDRSGNTDTKRRPDRERIPPQVCRAQSIKVSTQMVIRIKPAEAAGEALRALADAGAKDAQLFGYDFTDYDRYYQEAAEKAVALARSKAEAHARLAGTRLGEIESFKVTAPAQTGRFGPQPNVIRSAKRYRGETGSAVDRQVNRKMKPGVTPPLTTFSCWDGSVVNNLNGCPPAPQAMSHMTCWDGSIVSDISHCPVQAVLADSFRSSQSYSNARPTGRASGKGGGVYGQSLSSQSSRSTTNALSMSLLSGPQTIIVTANMSFSYETPLDGKVIVKTEK